MQAPKFDKFNDRVKKYFNRKKPSIDEVVREPTAGGIVYRKNKAGEIEILLIQDAKDRWTIPKGHIEEGETAQETALREIAEEAGIKQAEAVCWLGKIHFRYRRLNTLVLMTTQIYLVRALGDTNKIQKEEWMNGIRWFPFNDALEKIEYEDIGKLMLLAMKRIRHAGH
ncbi:MAG: NUDIX domain-containing protein [Candidatus Saccharimonadales bacterium]